MKTFLFLFKKMCNLFYLMTKKSDNFDFVILTMPRSGSTLLADLLNSHKKISCHDEVFHILNSFVVSKEKDPRLNFKKNTRIFFFKKVASYLRTNKNELLGCKILIGNFFNEKNIQLSGRLKEYVLKDKKLKVILIRRRNSVRRYISNVSARKNKIWHIKNNISKQKKIEFDFKEFLNFVKDEEKTLAKFYKNLDYKERLLEVYYEDIYGKDKENSLKKIQEFLGVEYQDLRSDFKKINNFDVSEMISNYEEVKGNIENWK